MLGTGSGAKVGPSDSAVNTVGDRAADVLT